MINFGVNQVDDHVLEVLSKMDQLQASFDEIKQANVKGRRKLLKLSSS